MPDQPQQSSAVDLMAAPSKEDLEYAKLMAPPSKEEIETASKPKGNLGSLLYQFFVSGHPNKEDKEPVEPTDALSAVPSVMNGGPNVADGLMTTGGEAVKPVGAAAKVLGYAGKAIARRLGLH